MNFPVYHCGRSCWFFCRGKLLNVRDASTTQVTGNAEIQNIKQILGLQHGKVRKGCCAVTNLGLCDMHFTKKLQLGP